VVRHPLAAHLADVVPYVSGVIELDGTQGAGARMIANIVDCDPESVAVGDKVHVVFDKVSDTLAIPRFAP
ncbi:MAG TPA: OB-fold domain-containing protein, partial [Acidimicrobiales bacterium]|nr:OB-fold domain-containing protein [Acidimicrobiales bacterium]